MLTTVFHIVIDSNQLIRDRTLSKADMLFIKALCKRKLLKLHIPWFIYMECITTNTNEILIELDKLSTSLRNIGKKGLNNNEKEEAKKIATFVDNLKEKVPDSVDSVWKDFIKETDSILYQYDASESIAVFRNYFNGEKPFKSLKSRMDIPDAFIYLTIKKIARNNFVHFITEDKNLREQLSDDKLVSTSKDFNELFASNMFIPIQKKYDQIEKNEKAREVLNGQLPQIKIEFEAFLTDLKPFSFFDKNLLSENSYAVINSIKNIEIILVENEIKYVNEVFYVPILAKVIATVERFVLKSEYWNEKYRNEKVTDWNDEYLLLEDELPLVIKKTIEVTIEGLNVTFQIEGFDEIVVDTKI